MKLDLGCGGQGSAYAGEYIGIDIWPQSGINDPIRQQNYIQADVVKTGIPFEDNSVDQILCSHVIEHLTRSDALTFLSEAKRVLKIGGTIECYVPDLYLMASAYVNSDKAFFDRKYPDGNPIFDGATISDKFLDGILGMGPHGHRYGYDYCGLTTLLSEVGEFKIVRLEDRGREEVGVSATLTNK